MAPKGRKATHADPVIAIESQPLTADEAAERLGGICFLPEVCVFDLDDTLWQGDVDLTSGPPWQLSEKADGRFIEGREGDGITLFPDVVEIFGWIEAVGLRAAVASATSKGQWAEAALSKVQTSQGSTLAGVASIMVCHRAESVTNRSKAVHLQQIADRAGCELCEMVFFDNMEHNIQDGESVQVTSCFTPAGLTWDKFVKCLIDYDDRALQRAAGT